ncbi:hypothetical protein [Brachybacterium sp. GCM10030252]|uniref:hypothetical protein n=1 Tax=Brachybacterium sp. GCM10030252 TaxID=3273380 RepID=UPI0036131B6A
MEDESRSAHRPRPSSHIPGAEECAGLPEGTFSEAGSAAAHRGLRDRATAGAAALGATAMLVLSFGPAALALSPSAPTTGATGSTGHGDRASVASPTPGSAAAPAPPRSQEDDEEDGHGEGQEGNAA